MGFDEELQILVEVVLYGQHSFYIVISLLEYFVGLLMKIMEKKKFSLTVSQEEKWCM